MAKYTKRKDGRYCTHIDTGTYDENGKRIRITVYARSIRELEEKITLARYNALSGTFLKNPNIPFIEYAKTWLNTKKSLSNATYNGYKNIIYNHFDTIGHIPVSKLVKSDIQDCIAELNGHYDLQQRLKITINQILDAAVEDNIATKNVCRGVKLPPRNALQKKRALTQSEISAIKKCSLTEKERAFIDILYYTGMRRGEVLALTVSDINFSKKEITVNKSVAFIDSNQPVIKQPKTRNACRTITMPIALILSLKRYIPTINTPYLFTRQNGEIMSEGSYKCFWRGIYNKINAQLGGNKNIHATDITVHMFRHNYATMLYYNGIDVKQAQLLLGHSNIKTTLEIYTHFISNESTKKKLLELSM